MRVIITGAGGQLAGELIRRLGDRAVPLDRGRVDICDEQNVGRLTEEHGVGALINCAAYTAVDAAEDDPQACWRTNAEAVESLRTVCEQADWKFVQLSTDYVFGAGVRRLRREADETSPQGVYARSKLAAEREAARWERHFVIRTCGLYAPQGRNFVETMLRIGERQESVRVVDDQVCSPTFAGHAADAILRLLPTDRYGTYHVVNRGALSWCDFAVEVFRQAKMNVRVEPISSAEFAARAPRPEWSALDTAKYESVSGSEMATWQEGLAEFFAAKQS